MLAEIQSNRIRDLNAIDTPAFIEYPLLLLQICIFAILYAVWVLPGTIALRNTCLVLGALLSLYPIFLSRKLLLRKSAIPIWLLIALFGWGIFHLLFLSRDPILQLEEFTSIWKRAAIGAVFALGMGVSIARLSPRSASRGWWSQSYWVIFYIGLLMPTLIYLIKIVLRLHGQRLGIPINEFVGIYVGPNAVYIAKTAYVTFCMPLMAAALGALLSNIKNHCWLSLGNLFYVLSLPAVFAVFFFENIKNGVVYGVSLIFIFIVMLIASVFKGRWFIKIVLSVLMLVASIWLVGKHLEENPSWKSFAADSIIAIDTSNYQQWKYNGTRGYPNNQLGVQVSVTNYERMAWAKEGVKLLVANPLGYGLVERSFGHLAKLQWPDSLLHQSHSGWLDLALGIGVPGILLVFGAILTIFWQFKCVIAKNLNKGSQLNSLFSACKWVLGALFLIWFTTEISQKVYFDALLFWLILSAGLGLSANKVISSSS